MCFSIGFCVIRCCGVQILHRFGGPIAIKKLPKDDHGLADQVAKLVLSEGLYMLFGIHEIEKQIDAALM
jgi:hypothetical protein